MHASFSANELLDATSCHLKSGYIDDSKGHIVWDIDEVKPGDWFIAIPNRLEDPHDKLDLAFDKGARGVIVNGRSRYASVEPGSTVIAVPDTKTALLDMVRYWRYCVQPKKVVGVSGSRGRRVTMILLHQLLKDTYRTHTAFMGHLGWFGCIKELLSMPKDTELLIFEAGAIERGDISRIGAALQPDLAILTPISHPLPSPERNALTASLYCELLETLSLDCAKEALSAVIYDDNAAVCKRSEELLIDQVVHRHSVSGDGLANKVPDESLKALSDAMESAVGMPVTRVELWCAIEAAKALGLSTNVLEGLLQLSTDAPELIVAAAAAE